MDYSFLIGALFLAIINLIAVKKSWRNLEYFSKPGVLLMLLTWVGINQGFQGPMLIFVLGLLLSIAGDIFLVLPNEHFMAGWSTFLACHIAYSIGFSLPRLMITLPMLLIAGILIIVGIQVFLPIAEACSKSGQARMRIPILLYVITSSLMVLTAFTVITRPDWHLMPAVLVSLGALLFYLSDLFLGYQRFISQLPNGKLFIIIAYHLGQFGIIWGALLHFS